MLKLGSSGKAIGTPVGCPSCRHPNLAIDIWCERCGGPLDWNQTQKAPAGYCPNCGAPNLVTDKYCQRCGSAMLETADDAPKPSGPPRRPGFTVPSLPAMKLPTFAMPKLAVPRISMPAPRVPRETRMVVVVTAVLVVLLLIPLAFARLTGGHSVAARQAAHLASTSSANAAGSPQAAAVAAVEAKTGLRFATNCRANAGCLSLAGQTVGTHAAAVVFSTASSGGRECAGYVFQRASGWQLLDVVCGLPNRLSPLLGRDATVHAASLCAHVRSGPGLSSPVVGCLPDGTVIHLDGGPTYADGRLWWHEKAGWMAHDFLLSA